MDGEKFLEFIEEVGDNLVCMDEKELEKFLDNNQKLQ